MPVSTELPSHFALNTGATIPAIGLGTWQAKPGEVKDAVKHALQVGYRHIDGALIYQVSQSDRTVDRGPRKQSTRKEDSRGCC